MKEFPFLSQVNGINKEVNECLNNKTMQRSKSKVACNQRQNSKE